MGLTSVAAAHDEMLVRPASLAVYVSGANGGNDVLLGLGSGTVSTLNDVAAVHNLGLDPPAIVVGATPITAVYDCGDSILQEAVLIVTPVVLGFVLGSPTSHIPDSATDTTAVWTWDPPLPDAYKLTVQVFCEGGDGFIASRHVVAVNV